MKGNAHWAVYIDKQTGARRSPARSMLDER